MTQDDTIGAVPPEERQEPAAAIVQFATVDEILAALDGPLAGYPREAVEAAIANREAITPRLIAIIEAAIANPDAITNPDGGFGLDFALMLLGHFREPAAHPAILKLCALPNEQADELMGDLITEDLPVILLRTASGNFEGIKSLAVNEENDQFVRAAAVTAIVLGVAEGAITREAALAFLVGLLRDEVDPGPDLGMHFALFEGLLWLHPEEHVVVIRTACDNGFLDPFEFPFKEVEKAVASGREDCLNKLQDELADRSLDDLHQAMSWWACFNPDEDYALPYHHPLPPRLESGGGEAKRKAKSKRKAAKAARQRNRKRRKKK